MLVLEWKERAFIEKVNSRCFCWFPAAILVHQNGAPIWRLHTKLYKGAWNVSANNSETVGHKNLRLGQIVYILVIYNILFSWLLPLDGFQFIFLFRDSENDLQLASTEHLTTHAGAWRWLASHAGVLRGASVSSLPLSVSVSVSVSCWCLAELIFT